MILDSFKLNGKVAIVTGASTGLGQGIALALSEAGAGIVGVDYVEMPETKERIESRGGRFLGVVANLMSTDPIAGIIQKTVEAFGRLDILVNNAGIIRRSDAIDFSEKLGRCDQHNLRVVFSSARLQGSSSAKAPAENHQYCSILSFRAHPFLPTASKSGVMGITRAMANEWAKHHININAIAPGYMATIPRLSVPTGRGLRISWRIPVSRWGTEDVQGPVVFCISRIVM